MREYELYLVIDAEAEEEIVSATVEKISELIVAGDGQSSGEVINVENRGKRRLAYPVRRALESQDVLFTFHAPPTTLTEVERVLKLDEQVLRYLIVRTDEK